MGVHVPTNTLQANEKAMGFLSKFMVKENYVSELSASDVFYFFRRSTQCPNT